MPGFWSRLFAPARPRAPKWSSFEDADLFLRFAEELRARLAASGFAVDSQAIASGVVRLTDAEGRSEEWVLWSLAEACAEVSPDVWPKLMTKHLRAAVKGNPLPAPAAPPARPSSELLSQVKLQVLRAAWLEARGISVATLVARPLAPGLVVVVMRALGTAGAATVAREEAAQYSVSEEEIFHAAELFSLAEDGPLLELRPVPSAAGTWTVAVSNGFYMSVCVLHALRRGVGARGALVAPLTWHHWAFVEVGEETTRETVEAFDAFARELAGKVEVPEESALGTGTFWWKDGAFLPIGVEEADGTRRIVVPEGLLLN